MLLEKLFSFRGRLARLEFLGWSLAAGVLLVVMAMVLVTAGIYSSSPGLAAIVIGLVMAVVYFWMSFALQAKRIRDIGLSPLMVIVGLMLFSMFDAAVLSRIIHFKLWSLGPNTGIGGLVNLAYLGMLLFWPGESGNRSLRGLWPDEPDPAPPVIARPSVAASSSPQPARLQQAVSRPGAPRREFGLRTR
jgi:uncharacterized membrane protein YhaH (DUF805 family)